MDLGDAAPATVTSRVAAPAVVVSAEAPTPFAVVRVCPVDEPCVLYQVPLPGDPAAEMPQDGITPGSAVMVTSRGEWIVGIDSELGGLRTWQIDLGARSPADAIGARRSQGADDDAKPAVLVASMRNSNLVLVRDAEGELHVFHPTWDSLRAIESGSGDRTLEEDYPNLKVVAIGEQWIVGREDIDGERERLVLVPIDPDLEGAFVDELVEADGFTRVEITANDARIVATSGEGDGAETFVFDVASGALVDRFAGGAVTSLRDLDAVPGLRATSPDGSHLAYRTTSGALALRDLGNHSACLVRSASAGDHRVAGFAADGTIYMQADLDYAESRMFAYETSTRSLSALDIEPGSGHHLAAAPARVPEGGKPYAIGVRHGQYAGMQVGYEPTSLGMSDAVWLARDDDGGAMWAAETYRESGTVRRLALRRFEPELVDGAYVFPSAAEAAARPAVLNMLDATTPQLATLDHGDRPCLSGGIPGAWAYQCASAGGSGSFLANSVPTSEDPGAPEMPDPEIPDYGDDDGAADEGEAEGGSDESGESSSTG
jgi:hypothetical protein